MNALRKNGKIQLLPLRGTYTSISMLYRHDSTIWQGTDRSKKSFNQASGGLSLADVSLNPYGA